jgi:hypothetical protein
MMKLTLCSHTHISAFLGLEFVALPFTRLVRLHTFAVTLNEILILVRKTIFTTFDRLGLVASPLAGLANIKAKAITHMVVLLRLTLSFTVDLTLLAGPVAWHVLGLALIATHKYFILFATDICIVESFA